MQEPPSIWFNPTSVPSDVAIGLIQLKKNLNSNIFFCIGSVQTIGEKP